MKNLKTFSLAIAMLISFLSFGEEKTITGVVSDADGTLIGASVVVKGTTRDVATKIDGKYEIKASVGETLVFSFVGLEDQAKVIGTSNIINMTLMSESKVMNEVIVKSTSILKKKDALTYSTEDSEFKEITEAVKPNVPQSLIKNVSGLQIKNTNNDIDPNSRIVFRCKRDTTRVKEALIVIDDKIATMDEFQKLGPESIDQVNVIKGAQGAALYGVNGANGVIVVKTKLETNQKDPIVFKKTILKVNTNNDNCEYIEENVVGAMGIIKKKEAQTYSTQVIKSRELTQAANPNIVQSLVGKVSGLQINTTNNSVNPTSRIIIRGNRSISGNNEALIVIDNIISSSEVLTALAPETIETIYVIKGTQGAALYGAYGANGVIMVRTKLECDEENSEELNEPIMKDVPQVVVNYPNYKHF